MSIFYNHSYHLLASAVTVVTATAMELTQGEFQRTFAATNYSPPADVAGQYQHLVNELHPEGWNRGSEQVDDVSSTLVPRRRGSAVQT